jgi:hypothetical protein
LSWPASHSQSDEKVYQVRCLPQIAGLLTVVSKQDRIGPGAESGGQSGHLRLAKGKRVTVVGGRNQTTLTLSTRARRSAIRAALKCFAVYSPS